MLSKIALAAAILLSLISAGRAANVDPEALGKLDITTFPPEKRDEAHKMLARDVSERLKEANRRESTAWAGLHSAKDWEAYAKARIEKMRVALNVPDDITTRKPPKVVVAKTITGDGWAVDDIVFESRPDFWVTANLYRPLNPPKSLPGILLSHSHHNPKTETELREMGVGWARAGCYVLVPDHLGHGERREHPFNTAADYPKQFRVGRQDYYFRYESSIRLYAAGETLMGWMAYDLSRGVDVLLAQPDIDANRIALLGSVAGGGDPAAVTAALDTRIKAVAPFNFGGPQPETRYPLPQDAETWFNYAGGGSWESTRNLYRSAADGFLPWVIVGSIAPRTLIYSHEFSWDREHDPVWKRLETIWGWYGAKEKLAFAHGRGTLKGTPPEASHCNNIGPIQRKMVAAALKQTIGIPEPDYGNGELPKAADLLIGPTGKAGASKLQSVLTRSADEQLRELQLTLEAMPVEQRRARVQAEWKNRLRNIDPSEPILLSQGRVEAGVMISPILILPESGVRVACTILNRQPKVTGGPPPVVVMFARAGKQKLLSARRKEIATMLDAGCTVCLVDLRGFGETSPGGRDRGSEETSIAASYLMLGDPLIAAQLRDLRGVLRLFHKSLDVDATRIAVWGDSLTPANPQDVAAFVPEDLDQPTQAEPSVAMVALLAGLFDDVAAVYTRGGIASYRELADKPASHVPLAAIVPGVIPADDVSELVAALSPKPVRQDAQVDILNRLIKQDEEKASPAAWMIEQLKKK